MNKTLLAFIVIALSVSSCKKDSTESCVATDTTQTYTAKVKPILDMHCTTAGCHDAGTQSGGVNLTNYNGAVDATKTHSLLTQVETGLLPQGMPHLSDAEINSIKAWRDNCYQQ